MKFPRKINTILSEVLKDVKIDEGIKNWQIIEQWSKIVGKKIAQHTRAVGVDANNLFVEVDNPLWKSQLFLMKDMIIRKLRKYNVRLKDIKFSIVNQREKR
ncbi:MAG TPA: DUF721 domain-containing protein [candidate division WOR-3 bacterium]|uniref:DUF721 domain-containing protein n=1 Tax=candidate division WOR-3 bacterium TaxID=2052148 RepID=A0A9C9EL99_UNCW3|nr:DUF721 domain-containing protein [candidate division WOR-3 bacterium]